MRLALHRRRRAAVVSVLAAVTALACGDSAVREEAAGFVFLLPYYRIKVRATYADTPEARDRIVRFASDVARVMPSSRRAGR
jgi:hypothetical protein